MVDVICNGVKNTFKMLDEALDFANRKFIELDRKSDVLVIDQKTGHEFSLPKDE